MSRNLLFLAETLITLGLVLGFGIWQLRSLRRLRKERDAAAPPEAADRPPPPHDPQARV